MGLSKYERRPRRSGKRTAESSMIRSSFRGDELVASNYGGSVDLKRNMKVEFRGLRNYDKMMIHQSPPRIPKWLVDYRNRNGIKLPKQYITEV